MKNVCIDKMQVSQRDKHHRLKDSWGEIMAVMIHTPRSAHHKASFLFCVPLAVSTTTEETPFRYDALNNLIQRPNMETQKIKSTKEIHHNLGCESQECAADNVNEEYLTRFINSYRNDALHEACSEMWQISSVKGLKNSCGGHSKTNISNNTIVNTHGAQTNDTMQRLWSVITSQSDNWERRGGLLCMLKYTFSSAHQLGV